MADWILSRGIMRGRSWGTSSLARMSGDGTFPGTGGWAMALGGGSFFLSRMSGAGDFSNSSGFSATVSSGTGICALEATVPEPRARNSRRRSSA
jgi:hypothetical protein